MSEYTGQPANVTSVGTGIPWQLPSLATDTGTGVSQQALITSVAISGNVVTFHTVALLHPYVAGQSVSISGMAISTFLNGAVLVVLPGATTTQFTANYSHANLATVTDVGVAQSDASVGYTLAQNVVPTPPPGTGHYQMFFPAKLQGGGQTSGVEIVFHTPYGYTVSGNACAGFSGNSFSPTLSSSAVLPTPVLPTGAAIATISLVVMGQKTIPSGYSALISLSAHHTGDIGDFATFSLNGSWSKYTYPLGSDLTVLNGTSFLFKVQSSDYTQQVSYSGSVTACGVLVDFTMPTGTPPTSGVLQTLTGINCGIVIPSGASITGLQVNFTSGLDYGTSSVLSVQLTASGTPVGTAKSVSVAAWPTEYVLGGPTDKWGSSLSTSADAGTVGVNVSGTVAANSQVDLNALAITVWYITPIGPGKSVIWVSVGNTRPRM
jgi:hypothetical protein